jgi:hypothetical protein
LHWVFVVIFPLLAAATRLSAELQWSTTRIDVAPRSTDAFASAAFGFRNAGPDPVTIREVHPDCSCVAAPLEKTTYEPGESGVITAVFTLGGQTGDHTVPIEVRSDAKGKGASTVLVFHVAIVDAVIFSERFLYWQQTDPLTPKTVTVTLLAGEDLEFKDVKATNPRFTVDRLATDDPRKILLKVTPPSSRERAICPISVVTTSLRSGKTTEHTMTARVL